MNQLEKLATFVPSFDWFFKSVDPCNLDIVYIVSILNCFVCVRVFVTLVPTTMCENGGHLLSHRRLCCVSFWFEAGQQQLQQTEIVIQTFLDDFFFFNFFFSIFLPLFWCSRAAQVVNKEHQNHSMFFFLSTNFFSPLF